MRISDWSSDVCSSDLLLREVLHEADGNEANVSTGYHAIEFLLWGQDLNGTGPAPAGRSGTPMERHAGNRPHRSEEHTSELQSLMRISYAVFCLKKKTNNHKTYIHHKTITQQ